MRAPITSSVFFKKKKKILSKTEQSGTVLIMNNEHMKLYTIFFCI